jgi:outer membrane protein TolC
MKRTLIVTAAVFFSVVFSGLAQESNTEGGEKSGVVPGNLKPLELSEFLLTVQSNNPFFVKERLGVDIERKQAQSLLGAQDWVLGIVPSYSYFGKASAPEFGAEQLHAAQVDASLERALWSTGGRLGFSATTGYSSSDLGLVTNNAYRHGVAASYTQPLLQNRKGILDRLPYELSEYTVDFTRLQTAENQEEFLLDVALRYLDWAFSTREVSIRSQRLFLAQQELEQVQKRFKANLVDKLDVLRSEDSVRLARQALLLAESQLQAEQAALAVVAGTNDIMNMYPRFDIFATAEIPPIDEAVEQLKSRSRILGGLRVLKEQLEYQRAGAQDTKRAQLDLSVSAGLYGRDELFGESLVITKPEASVALLYSKPLGSTTAKGQIAKLDDQILQVDAEIRSTENDLESSLVRLLVQLQDMTEILKLNQAQIESARDRTVEEIKLYNQGRSSLPFVIQSRDNEENARLTYAVNARTYQSLVLSYRALVDELFVPDEVEEEPK